MKTIKLITALFAASALLYIVHVLTLNRPQTYAGSDGDFTFEVTTTPLAVSDSTIELAVTITGPFSETVVPVIRRSKFAQDKTTRLSRYGMIPLTVKDSANNIYSMTHKVGRKGFNQYYYFEVLDGTGGRRAIFTRPDGLPFKILSIGAIPIWLLLGHILFIFVIFFFVFLAAIEAISLLKNSATIEKTARLIAISTVIALVACYPLSFALNSFKTGTFWEGFPFGTHIDNNKIQLLFVYLLFLSLSTVGSLTRGRFGRDLFSPRMVGLFTLVAPVLCLIAVLIPHSYPADPGLVTLVSQSFICMTALLLGLGIWFSFRSKPKANSKGH